MNVHNGAMVKKRDRTYEPRLRRRLVLGGALALAAAPTWAAHRDLAVGVGPSTRDRLRAALAGLGGLGRFVRPGANVLIKPNAGYARVPELGATTSPELLAEVIIAVRAAGAGTVRVADNPVDPAARAFDVSGLGAACRSLAAPLVMPGPAAFDAAIPIEGCALFRGALEDVDVVINLANAKAHPLIGIGGASVNLLGLLGGDRPALHPQLARHISTVTDLIPAPLNLIDGARVMLSQGPAAGTRSVLRHTPVLCAGTTASAVDAWAWRHLLQRGDALPAFLSRT